MNKYNACSDVLLKQWVLRAGTHSCITEVWPTEGSGTFLLCEGTMRRNTEPHPQNPVVILLFYSEEVAVVLPQDNGGSAGGVINKRELSKVIPLMKSAHNALCNSTH